MHPSYPEFRRKLDEVLRRRDPAALREFLVAEGEWEPGTVTDPERAMWLMIATSPSLADQRGEAVRWLAAHGHEEEARLIGGDKGAQRARGGPRRPEPRRHGSPAPPAHDKRRKPDHPRRRP
jgi:hypothetical protein